jgi:hypothetical protein
MTETPEDDEFIGFPMRWPAQLRDRVFAAENRRAQARSQHPSVTAWLREAAVEKLERDEEKGQ